MTNEIEIWKDVPNYDGMYQVSILGNVRSLKFGKIKILKASISNNGYYKFVLCKYGKEKTFSVHKLITLVFLGSPNGLHVNHKDRNKSNNTLENLEYVSSRDNTTHGKCSMQKENKSSKYIGVSFKKKRNKYQAQIGVNGKNKYLGLFETEIEASNAYQKALSEIEPNTVYASKN